VRKQEWSAKDREALQEGAAAESAFTDAQCSDNAHAFDYIEGATIERDLVPSETV
jgi:hypothetical protein